MREALNHVGERIIGAALKVHTALGPGLLESAYEACLAHELSKAGLHTARQVALPLRYDGVELDCAYRLDLVVESLIVVELKSVEKLLPIHSAQLIAYLKMGQYPLGYLLNFNTLHLRDGVKRLINSSCASAPSVPSL
ncbi:MAG: GxxExxY protein [Thiobacillus sp.]|nr:GxxExxY protein [Thiobacillus sp.]